MNLGILNLATANKYTSHYPLLLTGASASGKSYALEQMSDEDKARTIVFNMDVKPCGSGSPTEFAKLYSIVASSATLDKQLTILQTMGKKLIADGVDKKDPKMIRLSDQTKHLKKIKSHSFFIDDGEAIDKIVESILESTFDSSVDRIVMDTLTALIDFCEAWATKNFSGREIWGNYGTALQRIMQAMKEATIFGGKYTYTFAHHDFIPAAQYATTPKQVVKVKGGIMSGNVEMHYNTVVYAYLDAEGDRRFECSNNNSLDTSRTKLVSGEFTFKRESLDDLELLFAGKASVVDGVLTPNE